ASPEFVSKLLKRATSVLELKNLKNAFGEQKTTEAWHLLDKSDRIRIKRICNENQRITQNKG
ncbi:MAG: hypothetical protein J7647_22075, partial [Cyanobacteria bacterium SBLK]|nr:hypothetical protein [Cyanobacteria bacterium SBLK]